MKFLSFPRQRPYALLFSLCAVLALAASAAAGDAVEWRPVTPAELKMDKPVVEPDADAEAIFWEITLDDKKRTKMTMSHYVRVKIFTERGREKFSKFDIPFVKGIKIENVAARVIRPDGSVTELQPGDIFEREIVKAGKLKVRAKSFAVPNIEPGVIVEYQYEEVRKNDSVSGERLSFQRDIPMQKVAYYVRPYKDTSLETTPYNMTGDTRFVDDRERKGFQVLSRTNVPALKDEPYMPPEDEVRQWVFLRYITLGSLLNWANLSMNYQGLLKEVAKPDKTIRRKAEELTAGAGSEDEKLRRLYDFVQNDIKNVTYDTTLTEDERDNLKLKDADDVLKRGMGTSGFIDLLFAALAQGAGFNVNLAVSGDRSEQFFNPNKYKSTSFIRPCCIAVKVNDQWKFFNPGTPFLPYGKLVWYEEDVVAMLVGDGGYMWIETPLSNPEDSPAKRTGRFKLLEDGTLEGTARIEYSGHQAISRRRDAYEDSQAKREEDFREEIRKRISTAEISDLRIENFNDPNKPLAYEFKMKVPNYAQKTGKRLFFKPSVFEYGADPVFSAATRTYDVYFPYPWSEEDDIEIRLPEGHDLDNADSPGDVADPNGITSLKIGIGVDREVNTLVFSRKFHFGGGGNIFFKVGSYPALKNLFDAFNQSDQHQITLKKEAVE